MQGTNYIKYVFVWNQTIIITFFDVAIYLGAVYMRKIIPPRWDVSPEWDLGGMVYFTL